MWAPAVLAALPQCAHEKTSRCCVSSSSRVSTSIKSRRGLGSSDSPSDGALLDAAMPVPCSASPAAAAAAAASREPTWWR